MKKSPIDGAIDPGRLRHRVDLERDDLTFIRGAEVRTPVVYARNLPARAESGGGREEERGQAEASIASWTVLIRYRSDTSPIHRVVFRGKKMEIKSITEDARQRWMIL